MNEAELDADLLRAFEARLLGVAPELRPDQDAIALRAILRARTAASPALVLRIWRELTGEALARGAGLRLAVWGGRQPGRAVELARQRFGAAPPLQIAETPEAALAVARQTGGLAVLALEGVWWAKLLAEPRLRVFAALPELRAGGGAGALAVGDVPLEPSGGDETFWVTDAAGPTAAIEAALASDGVAAEKLMEAGGLKLYSLAGYFQRDDERLARAPGRLTGVIGAAPQPFDL